jgi:hypothetical protein
MTGTLMSCSNVRGVYAFLIGVWITQYIFSEFNQDYISLT